MQLTQYKCFFSCQKQIECLSVLITKFLSSLMLKSLMFFLFKFHIATAINFYEPVSRPITLFVHVCPWDTRGKTHYFSQWQPGNILLSPATFIFSPTFSHQILTIQIKLCFYHHLVLLSARNKGND